MPIILRPLINEKSMMLVKNSLYTFETGKDSNKQEIAREVSQKFDVDVLSVKTIKLKGKQKRQRSNRKLFFTSGIKKAIVAIKKGQKIALFEASPETAEAKVTTVEGELIGTEKTEPKLIKEKKSLLRGTKVKIEQARGQDDFKKSHKEKKKGKV